MTKKAEKRIKFGDLANEILDEYCELYGLTPSAAITTLIVDVLGKRVARVRLSFGKNTNSIYTTPSTKQPKSAEKKPRKKLTTLPEDFSPPRAIAEEAGVDHEMAVRFFKAQAEAKDYKYRDWNKAYALAVNGYLLQNFPQIAAKPKDKYL
tara:strand:+ start:22 stop:474 length:453 start_codon:yes stop_codon:yes gene_type:complete